MIVRDPHHNIHTRVIGVAAAVGHCKHRCPGTRQPRPKNSVAPPHQRRNTCAARPFYLWGSPVRVPTVQHAVRSDSNDVGAQRIVISILHPKVRDPIREHHSWQQSPPAFAKEVEHAVRGGDNGQVLIPSEGRNLLLDSVAPYRLAIRSLTHKRGCSIVVLPRTFKVHSASLTLPGA